MRPGTHTVEDVHVVRAQVPRGHGCQRLKQRPRCRMALPRRSPAWDTVSRAIASSPFGTRGGSHERLVPDVGSMGMSCITVPGAPRSYAVHHGTCPLPSASLSAQPTALFRALHLPHPRFHRPPLPTRSPKVPFRQLATAPAQPQRCGTRATAQPRAPPHLRGRRRPRHALQPQCRTRCSATVRGQARAAWPAAPAARPCSRSRGTAPPGAQDRAQSLKSAYSCRGQPGLA